MSQIDIIDRLVEVSARGLETTLKSVARRPQVIGDFNRLVEEAGVTERHYQQLRLVLAGTDGTARIDRVQKLALCFIKHENPEGLRRVGVLARAYAGVFCNVNTGSAGFMVQRNLWNISYCAERAAVIPLPANFPALLEGEATVSSRLSGILTRLRALPICLALVGLVTFDRFILPCLFEEDSAHKAMS